MPSPPQLQNVAIEVDSGAIAIVKYNRPKAGNALHTATVQDILAALKWADAEDEIRIIITTGEGKFYTTGLDLLDKTNHGPNGETICDEFIEALGSVHDTLIRTPKLTISAVNGPAPGWGTTSLSLTDLVYSVPNATFFTPFVQWGLCAEGCSSFTFTSIMGRQKASALILAGARCTAAEMESAGLISKILPQESFFSEVLNIARGIAKMPAEALKVNKELMMQPLREKLLETNQRECVQLRKQVAGKESMEAIQAFARAQEKRKSDKAKSKL